jgi:hypothetical protein
LGHSNNCSIIPRKTGRDNQVKFRGPKADKNHDAQVVTRTFLPLDTQGGRTMSSLKDSAKLCAKLAVKVPQPDSLVEVRVTPPDSNFEVKILPGEDVIELTIRPVGSLIEVRIGPSGLEPAGTSKASDEAGGEMIRIGPAELMLEETPEEAEEEARGIPTDLELAPEPDPAPEYAEAGAGEAPGETAAEAPDFGQDPGEVFAVPDNPLISGAAGPAVLAALARLSVAVGEERAALDNVLEAQSQAPKPEPAPSGLEEAAPVSLLTEEEEAALASPLAEEEEAAPVSPLAEEEEAAPASPLAEEEEAAPAPPLAEEDDAASDPAEHQSEELALGPLDVQALAEEVDLGQPDGPVVKAKPLVKAAGPVA